MNLFCELWVRSNMTVSVLAHRGRGKGRRSRRWTEGQSKTNLILDDQARRRRERPHIDEFSLSLAGRRGIRKREGLEADGGLRPRRLALSLGRTLALLAGRGSRRSRGDSGRGCRRRRQVPEILEEDVADAHPSESDCSGFVGHNLAQEDRDRILLLLHAQFGGL